MQKFNYHAHTVRCKHASGTEEEYVKQAIKAGYERIGFSDHAPYTGITNPSHRMESKELFAYRNEILRLKEAYKDQIEIYVGLEVENYSAYREDVEEYAKLFDYLILGQHSYEYGDGLAGDYYRDHEDKWLMKYAEQVVSMMETGLIDIVAHPDLYMSSTPIWNETCEMVANKICEASKRLQIPLEVNMGAIRFGKKQIGEEVRYLYPYSKFWEVAERHQCPVIYGIDAHSPERYMDQASYEEVNALLKGMHLNFVSDEGIVKEKNVLESERLYLRTLKDLDSEQMYELAKDSDVGPRCGWKPHESQEESLQIIQKFLKKDKQYAIIEKESNVLIGVVGLSEDSKRNNPKVKMLGYWLGKTYWGKGYMKEAVEIVLKQGFEQEQLDMISVCHFDFNNQSQRVIEKLGFVKEGVIRLGYTRYDGKVFDDVTYSMTKEEWKKRG